MHIHLIYYSFLAFSLLVNVAVAANVQLFTHGKISPYYDEQIKKLKIGDRIEFSNGNEFTVSQILGHGKMNLIIEVIEATGKVLRIPLTKNTVMSIHETIRGTEELKDYDSNLILVDFAVPGEFVIHRKVSGRLISLSDFINYRSQSPIFRANIFSNNYLSTKELQIIENELFEFLEKFYLISRFADLNSGNLVYSLEEKKWLIIDVMSGNQRANKVLESFAHAQTFVAFGYFLGPQFIAHDQKYLWLQNRMSQLNHRVLKLRKSYFSLSLCRNVFN